MLSIRSLLSYFTTFTYKLKNSVKGVDKDEEDYKYLTQDFPQLNDAELKKGIFEA